MRNLKYKLALLNLKNIDLVHRKTTRLMLFYL